MPRKVENSYGRLALEGEGNSLSLDVQHGNRLADVALKVRPPILADVVTVRYVNRILALYTARSRNGCGRY